MLTTLFIYPIFFFNDTATTEIYTLPLHDALPIWIRFKASLLYASGDSDARDGEGNGFDTILDNPNFTGGPFSWYVREGFNLAGTAVRLKQRNNLVPHLRPRKNQGPANFLDPGGLLLRGCTRIQG